MCLPNDKTYQTCFEILGFDVLIDECAKPWLIEVNHAPSFATDSDLDFHVKKSVIMDTFKVLGLSKNSRKKTLDRMLRETKLRQMYRGSNAFFHRVVQEDTSDEVKEKEWHQLNNLGGYNRIFPVESMPKKDL